MSTSTPVRIQVTRWKCPHCSRSRAAKQATTEHIARCWRNPTARSCKTCTHYLPGETGPDCFPDRTCDCSNVDEGCLVDIEMPENGLPINCPKWSPNA